MVLKLRIRIERSDGKYSVVYEAIANSGFSGKKPEILVPLKLIESFKLRELQEPTPASKISGSGTVIPLIRYIDSAKIYVIEEDRVKGPITADVLIAPKAKYILLNDKLLGMLEIVIIDPADGLWCFRDEIGKRVRKGVGY
ncbi:MAG: hypothetical protein QXY40_00300 [Candidatus Methanomethylicia archaeon]